MTKKTYPILSTMVLRRRYENSSHAVKERVRHHPKEVAEAIGSCSDWRAAQDEFLSALRTMTAWGKRPHINLSNQS